MGYIYKITNILDGKCYIGQTKNDLNDRWKNHKNKNSNCIYLKNAFQKYGVSNFKFQLVCICFDEDLNKYEIEYIKKFNSLVPNGYNLKKGGENGGKHAEETKQKISETIKAKLESGEIIPHKSQSGIPHTEERKNKISNTMKKLCSKDYVLKYSLNNEFIKQYESITDASIDNKIRRDSLSSCKRGRYKTAGGYIWKFIPK
jgi:group I intron endonuclease